MKVSTNNQDVTYFEASLTDGKRVIRMVSFESHLRRDMESFKEKDESISCVNCNVRRSKFDDTKFEVVASSKLRIPSSPKKFKLSKDKEKSNVTTSGSELSELAEIGTVAVQNALTVKGKFVSVDSVDEVQSKNVQKRWKKLEHVLADKSSACRFVLWEEMLDVAIGKSYNVDNATVKIYNGERYLSSTCASVIEEVADIGEVAEYAEGSKNNLLVRSLE